MHKNQQKPDTSEGTQSETLSVVFQKSIGLSAFLFVATIALQNLLSSVAASYYGFSSIVYLNSIEFLVDAYGWKSYGAVVSTYLLGIAIIMTISTIAYFVYYKAWQMRNPNLGFVMGWVHLIGYLWCFADIVSGQVMKKGPYFGFNFLLHKFQLTNNIHYAILVLSIICLYVAGGLSAFRVLRAVPSVRLLLSKGNKAITWQLLILPVAMAISVIALTYTLISGFNLRFIVNMLFVASSVLVGWLVCERYSNIRILKYYTVKKPTAWIILAVLTFGVALLMFGGGFRFD